MKVVEAKNCFFEYHRIDSKKSTLRNYEIILSRFCDQFGERDVNSIPKGTNSLPKNSGSLSFHPSSISSETQSILDFRIRVILQS